MTLRAGESLFLLVVGLLTIGVVMVNSAGLTVGGAEPPDLAQIALGRPAVFALLAVALLLVASRVPVGRLLEARGALAVAPWILGGAILLLLAVHVPGIGREVNGARRWIDLGPVGFQPSELAKWGLLFVIAWYAARHPGAMGRLGAGFLAPMLVVGGVCALIGAEDLGTAVLIGVVATVMLVAAGARVWYPALLAPAAAGAFIAAVVTNPYRINRLRAFLDPFDDPQGIGYHVVQSMAAVSGGGLAGRGLGNGVQKFGYLPEDTTDFVFAVINEELGLAGAALVVALYATLLSCGLLVITRTQCPFRRLLGLGILLTIGLQALLNLLVVTGLAPTKGIALPLVSAGGTGWCLTAFSIGILISIDRESRKQRVRITRDASAPHANAPVTATVMT